MAIEEGYVADTPLKCGAKTVVHLPRNAAIARHRRLAEGEEAASLKHAGAHLHGLIVAALEAGCRLGDLLGLQWKDIEQTTGRDGKPFARYLLLPATKTKTYQTRRMPLSTNLWAVLATRQHDPAGKMFKAEAFVSGNEVGEEIGLIKSAWRLTCNRAKGCVFTTCAASSARGWSNSEPRRTLGEISSAT
ncbi:MAG: hypothetical protein HY048_11165 [Acidobacteria bacterium]|nr:hypothetical protein [Acidobacteriota bacterium]